MINVSATGLSVLLVAVKSFPIGFQVTQFADDVDPITSEDVESSGFEMLCDGTLFAFDKASPVLITLGVIAGSEDDINLKVLLASRRGGLSLMPLEDSLSAVISYPDGGMVALSNGTMIKGPLVDSVTAAGRKKGNQYTIAFGSYTGAQSFKQIAVGLAQSVASVL